MKKRGALDIKISNLKSASAESFLWGILGVGCLFLMHVMLGQTLSAENYGVFSFALSIISVLVLFATMGWPSALVRFIPQYTVNHQWAMLKGVLIRSHQLSLGISVIFSLMLLYLSTIVESSERSDAIFFASIFLPVSSFIVLRKRIFHGFQNVKGSIIPDEVIFPAIIVLLLFFINKLTFIGVMWIYIFSACTVLVLTYFWLWRTFPLELKSSPPAYDLRKWLGITFPLFLGGLSQVFFTQSGIFMLGFFDDYQGAGLFGVSFRLSLFVTFAMTSINVIGMPLLAAAFHENNAEKLKLLQKKTIRWSFYGALPPFLVFMIFPETMLSIFGEDFISASRILQILSLGQLANASVGLSGSLLVVAGEQRFFAISMIIAASFGALLMYLTIPVWGEYAAAVIYAGILFLLSLSQLYRANKLIYT